jgi:hypothetical protein
VPALTLPDGLLAGLGWGLLVVGAGVLLGVLLRFVVVRLFLLDPPGSAGESGTPGDPDAGGSPVWVAVKPPGAALAALAGETDRFVVDLLCARVPEDCARLVPEHLAAKLIVVDHVETRLGSGWSEAVVSLLEDLVFRRDARVVVLSEVDPLAFLSDQFAHSEPTDPDARKVVETFWRWVQVFAACETSEVRPAQVDAKAGPLAALIAGKAAPADGQDARYWRIWAESTKAEKLAMSQLAHEGFLNPNNRDVARRLARRGLVRFRPAFAFFADDFRRFVLRAEPPRDVLQWEREGGPGWRRVQTPLLVAVAVVVAFFFVTQPHAYTAGLALLGALSTAVPRLLEVAGFFGRRRAAGDGG